MNKQIIKNTIILACITLIAGIALGLVYDVTKEPIAEQQQLTKEKACKTVFAEADSFDIDNQLDVTDAGETLKEGYEGCTIDEAIPALDKKGNLLGYALTVTCSEGYGGNITLMMGVTVDGTLNGIEFLTINETAGLGMNAKEPAFKEQFKEKPAGELKVTKEDAPADDEIQAISAATITSKAVTKAVNAGREYITFRMNIDSRIQKGGDGDE